MSQIRLHLTAGKLEAERIFELLEREFEDDGFALDAMSRRNVASGTWAGGVRGSLFGS